MSFATNEDVAEIANAKVCGQLTVTPEDVALASHGSEPLCFLDPTDDWIEEIKKNSEANEILGNVYDSGGFEGELRRCAFAVLDQENSSAEAKTLAMHVLGLPGEAGSLARQYAENGGRIPWPVDNTTG